MMAGTPTTYDQTIVPNGLISDHAYSVLSAYVVKNADGSEKAKLFLMRNPWGNDGNFNGSWSDKDPIWNDKVNNYAK